MNYSRYYEARELLEKIISKDLLGPVTENEILCDERPLDYYILGKLYPQGSGYNEQTRASSEDCGDLDEEIGVSLSNSGNPSSFGLSFSLNSGIPVFRVLTKAAQYILITEDEARKELAFEQGKYKATAYYWKRLVLDLSPVDVTVDDLVVGKVKTFPLSDHLSLKVLVHKIYSDGSKTLSVSMVNDWLSDKEYITDAIHAFYQPAINIVALYNNSFGDVRRNIHFNQNDELAELELLYRKIGNFASGHGCAVNWNVDSDG